MSKLVTDGASLLAAFPAALSRDSDKAALGETIAGALSELAAGADMAAVLPRVETLPEAVLDTLAADLNIQWYEADAPIQYKRRAVQECMVVHRYKGTKYAVEAALRSMYDAAAVQEWFDYGGEPYHFRVEVYGSGGSALKTLYLKILYAKNLRSVLDDIEFYLVPSESVNIYCGIRAVSAALKLGAVISGGAEGLYTSRGRAYAAAAVCAYRKRLGAAISGGAEGLYTSRGRGYAGIKLAARRKRLAADFSAEG